jgi:recombination protein RecR
MLHIAALEKLVHEFSRLPGIGPKTAQRLAYYVLRSSPEYSHRLAESLVNVHEQVHMCPQCFSYTDKDLCRYCQDQNRNADSICVVEEPSDIIGIEASGAFRGRYHVLHGAISPLDGVNPSDLKIDELLQRLSNVREIIFALDADLEGDTTVLYLSKVLANRGLRLSRIAHGIPIGGDIEYIDDRTMGRALENRVEI